MAVTPGEVKKLREDELAQIAALEQEIDAKLLCSLGRLDWDFPEDISSRVLDELRMRYWCAGWEVDREHRPRYREVLLFRRRLLSQPKQEQNTESDDDDHTG